MSTIQHNYQSVTQRLQQACADCGRDPASVRLLASIMSEQIETVHGA